MRFAALFRITGKLGICGRRPQASLFLGLLAGMAAALPIGPAGAQERYPVRTVEIVVPYGPGGTGDVVARALAQDFQRQLGVSFVVLNMPGAAGMLGAAHVARAKPDGYVLLLGYTSEVAIEPFLTPTSYDSASFVPLAIGGVTPLLLIGQKNLAAANMREFIDLARKHPGQFTYASAGFGSPAHIAGELLKRDARLDIRHVPFKGGADAVAAVLGGHVDIYFTGLPPAVGLVRNGDIKAFAITGDRRSATLPDVLTMAESGFADFDLSGWFTLFAPKGTPQDVLDRLRSAAGVALANPAVREIFKKNGVELHPRPTEHVDQFIDAESAKYRRMLNELAIKSDK